MINEVTVSLTQPEYNGLIEMADRNYRPIDMQLEWLLRQELERIGVFAPGEDRVLKSTKFIKREKPEAEAKHD